MIQIGKYAIPWWLLVCVALLLSALVATVILLVKRGKKHSIMVCVQHEGRAAGVEVGNVHNIGRRDEQQDSFYISDVMDEPTVRQKGALAVIADGMGGLSGGAQISRIVTGAFMRGFEDENIEDAGRFLYDTTLHAEQLVEEYMKQTSIDGGSTLVAVLVREGGMHFVSVGDSRICIHRDGKLIQVNREHNFGALLAERAARGEISFDEARDNPKRAALTAYIGMGKLKQIDRSLKPIPLQAEDTILLMSDGIFNTLDDKQIMRAIDCDAAAAAVRLENAVQDKEIDRQDNFTAVVLKNINEVDRYEMQ
ncbi:MAG: protein phosphatase 2C domain-containing protein [Clostridia bacterium]